MRTVAAGPQSRSTDEEPPSLFDKDAILPQKQAIVGPNFHIF